MIRWLTILLFVLLLGCTNDKPGDRYHVYIDPQFSASETQDILVALQEWKDMVNQSGGAWELTFIITIGVPEAQSTQEIVFHRSTLAEVKIRAEITTPIAITLHKPYLDRSDIWIGSDDPRQDHIYKEYRHELGHALGLGHLQKGTIMCYSMTCSSNNITPIDVAAYKKVRE